MADFKSLKSAVFDLDRHNFESHALRLFQYQAGSNEVYQDYMNHLEVDPVKIKKLVDIPFLPIRFFKNHKVVTGKWSKACVFESSGTTGESRSQHFIEDLSYYHQISQRIFEQNYGPLNQYHVIALLPTYLENRQSSLINMISHFMAVSNSSDSGFYMNDLERVAKKLKELNVSSTRKILLWGVSFALLDLAEKHDLSLSKCLVIATGGMKGRREELTPVEFYDILRGRWQVPLIHSEYGMTELISQCYTIEEGLFQPPPWMRAYIREVNDPFSYCPYERSGAINIVDLANVHTCAFIATDDVGLAHQDGSFEIFGRLDNSDQRGCNLMVPEITD
ncbi:MAG: acyl transferase [Cyclobacteriaceae bacterium]